ncbi:VWA domain-containing protein [bacterium]|nr:VWA domain-containing protein [bacterium]
MVQFANPAAWLFAGLFAVLIALYLWERSRRTIVVPSLLLWQTIPDSATRATRFVPDWLFVLQALLLLLLIAGLAGPYLSRDGSEHPSERAVFVLDTSASMQAQEGAGTRFELSKRAIGERITALGAGDEAMLIAAGPQPAVIVPPTTDHAEALRQLAALAATDTRADLDAALAAAQRAAARADRTTRVALFTDTPFDRLSPPWRQAVSVFPVGETDDNLSIDGIQIYQSRFDDPRAARAFVTVRNHAGREHHGVLTVQLDGTTFGRQGFTLPARSATGFPVPALPGPGVLRATLDADDALAADNVAYAVVHPLRAVRVLVVSDDPTLLGELRQIAAAAPGLELATIAPAAYDGTQRADLFLFHRVAPPLPTQGASLYVAPADPRGPFPPRGRLARVPLGDAAVGHPALRSVRLDLPFAFADVQILEAPSWAETLLTARADDQQLPLAFAGEVGGQRIGVLAYDLAAQGMLRADHTDLLLLLLDLVDWLVPANDDVHVIPTGSVEVIESLPSLPRHLVDPRGGEATLPADQTPLIDARYAGEYRVTAGDAAVRIFANLADPEESDIGRPAARPHEVAPLIRAGLPTAAPASTLAWPLYAAAATVLIVEWMAARRRG